MIIAIRRRTVFIVAGLLLAGGAAAVALWVLAPALSASGAPSSGGLVAGGTLRAVLCREAAEVPAAALREDDVSERFQRPSKQRALENPYSFKDFQNGEGDPPASRVFETPEEVLLAYYGLLREAANAGEYALGGCGTVGWSGLPYPYAYELLSPDRRGELSLRQFVDSFEGIGYITLLKMVPAYAPPDTPSAVRYFMVEIEVITGAKAEDECAQGAGAEGSHFAYFYGLVTAEETPGGGWKIRDVEYVPEGFLCAPVHGWFYWSDAVMEIVYGDNMKLIDRVDRTERDGDMVFVYAYGAGGGAYRFDFIRLTNGYDVLLHEWVLENGEWMPASLLTEGWEDFKFGVRR